jgi:uncharacterized protein
MAAEMPVEVAYALPDEQVVVTLALPAGSTAADALERSGLRTRFPEIAATAKLGIHGRIVAGDTTLAAGDRVEIYRPLIADPKQARRRRAEAKAAPKR